MSAGAAIALGWVADLAFGDPARRHPVAGFGRAAGRLEALMWAPSRARGAAFTAALVGGAAAAGALLERVLGRRPALALLTWAALGGRSLGRTARAVADAVERDDLDAARRTLPALVGRDPVALDAAGACRAATESVAENTGDAVVGALLWGAVAGPAGVAAFRAANTLDAMVGHRTPRHREFGWASARLDDALGWPAARAGVLLAAAAAPVAGGSPAAALRAARRDGAAHPSPNSGRLEAAFAGALGLRLGGPLSYGGVAELRPHLGDGRAPGPGDVRRAVRLSHAAGALAALLALGAAR